MKEIKGKIKNIKWDTNLFIIYINDEQVKIPIINGSVKITIKNSENKEVGIGYLDIGDLIKINISKNNSIKILINTKYEFISSSSEIEEII